MKKIALILLSLLAANAYAQENELVGMKQHVQVCLGVNGDASAEGFKAGFVSSDILNRTRWTKYVVNGTECVDLTYNHGPKKIKVKLEDRNNKGFIKVVPDGSCNYMQPQSSSKFESDYMATSKDDATQIWNLVLLQAPPEDGYRYVYNMSCEHIAQ